MSNDDEVMGYLRASVERNTMQVELLAALFKEHADRDAKHLELVLGKIQNMQDELNVYKTVIKVLKALGLTAAFILALKLGDIADLWRD